MSTTQLMDHFAFNLADLQANRKGQLSEAQLVRLKAEQKSFRRWTLFTGVSLIVGSFIFMLLFLSWQLVSPTTRLRCVACRAVWLLSASALC